MLETEAASVVWDDVELWIDGSGRLTVRRSKTDAEPRVVYLTPASMRGLDAIRPAEVDDSEQVFGLSVASISRRVKQAAENAGLGPGFSGHSGRVGKVSTYGGLPQQVECRLSFPFHDPNIGSNYT